MNGYISPNGCSVLATILMHSHIYSYIHEILLCIIYCIYSMYKRDLFGVTNTHIQPDTQWTYRSYHSSAVQNVWQKVKWKRRMRTVAKSIGEISKYLMLDPYCRFSLITLCTYLYNTYNNMQLSQTMSKNMNNSNGNNKHNSHIISTKMYFILNCDTLFKSLYTQRGGAGDAHNATRF